MILISKIFLICCANFIQTAEKKRRQREKKRSFFDKTLCPLFLCGSYICGVTTSKITFRSAWSMVIILRTTYLPKRFYGG